MGDGAGVSGDPACKAILPKHNDPLKRLYAEIKGSIADWNLSQADKALYTLGDVFDEIDWALDRALKDCALALAF